MQQSYTIHRAIYFSFVLISICLAGILAFAQQLRLQGQTQNAVYLSLFALFLGVISALEIRSLSNQLKKVRQRNLGKYQKIQKDSHGYMICKNPISCQRCHGWWSGFSTMLVAGVVGILFGRAELMAVVNLLGLPLTTGLGIVFAALTPIHGSYGTMKNKSKDSFIESDLVHFLVGILSALSILFLTIVVLATLY